MDRTLTAVDGLLPSISSTGLEQRELNIDLPEKVFFAKVFNGGKPFVDDLNIEVDRSGQVQIRSQSRIGDSDLGVNAKRVSYLAALLKAKGWKI